MAMELKVASPCKESWEGMTGDDRIRYCGACQKKVFNLTKLSQGEIAELLGSPRELPCVRFYERPDGTVMTADCPVGRRRRWGVRLGGIAATLLLLIGAIFLAQADRSPAAYPNWFEEILSWLRPKPVYPVFTLGKLIRPAPRLPGSNASTTP
jgi:hypothetical protein